MNDYETVQGIERSDILDTLPKVKATTLKERLKALRSFYSKHKWTTGALMKKGPEGPNGPNYAFCVQGAMMATGMVKPPEDGKGEVLDDYDSPVLIEMTAAMADAARDLKMVGCYCEDEYEDEICAYHEDIPSLNDILEHPSQILNILDHAIEQAGV